jgi:hypothetical protein
MSSKQKGKGKAPRKLMDVEVMEQAAREVKSQEKKYSKKEERATEEQEDDDQISMFGETEEERPQKEQYKSKMPSKMPAKQEKMRPSPQIQQRAVVSKKGITFRPRSSDENDEYRQEAEDEDFRISDDSVQNLTISSWLTANNHIDNVLSFSLANSILNVCSILIKYFGLFN